MKQYFSHDLGARNDEKCVALRMVHGLAGYGLYWCLIERLAESSNYMCVKDYNMVAFDLRSDAKLVKSVVEDFGLFAFTDDGKCFYSESLLGRMRKKDETSAKRQAAAKKRWSADDDSTHSTHDQCKSNAIASETPCKINAIAYKKTCKEKKVKEKKIKTPISPLGDQGSVFVFPFDEKSEVMERVREYTSDPELRKRFSDYVRFQYDAGKTVNVISIEIELKRHMELVEAGNDPVKIIEQSIEHGWKTMYPIKQADEIREKYKQTNFKATKEDYQERKF